MKNLKIELIKKILLLFITFTVLMGCEDQQLEQENIEPAETDQPLKVVDGVLYFKDMNAFEETMEELQVMDDPERVAWLSEVGFSNSLYLLTNDLTIEEVQSNAYLDVPDDAFAMVINEEGIYAIEEDIHKITQEEELIVSRDAYVSLGFDWEENLSIQRINIIYGENDYHNSTTISNNGRIVDDLIKTEPYNGDFRFSSNGSLTNLNVTHLSAHLLAWNRSYFAYASTGVKISGRKKRSGKWGDDTMWYAAISYDASAEWTINNSLSGNNNGTVIKVNESDGKSGVHVSSVQETIFFRSGVNVKIDDVNIIVDFTYEDDGYPRVYKNNVQYAL